MAKCGDPSCDYCGTICRGCGLERGAFARAEEALRKISALALEGAERLRYVPSTGFSYNKLREIEEVAQDVLEKKEGGA
jgi:hypothetical protein